MIATAILVKEGTAADVMERLESVVEVIKINGASPSRLLEEAHGLVAILASELAAIPRPTLTKLHYTENTKKRERLLTALDDSIVRYQRRAALLGLRG